MAFIALMSGRLFTGTWTAEYYITDLLAYDVRKKADADDKIPCILKSELTDMAFQKNWARLIQKIYEEDPDYPAEAYF